MQNQVEYYCAGCGIKLLSSAKYCSKCISVTGGLASYCRKCGAQISDTAKTCPKCGTEKGISPPAPSTPRRPLTMSEQLEKRYRDAYRVARVTIFFGGLAKGLAILFAALAVLSALVTSSQSVAVAVSGALFGVFSGLFLYVVGVLVAAHGQLLLTSIDNVINTSPLLTDSERAEIMRMAFDEAAKSTIA